MKLFNSLITKKYCYCMNISDQQGFVANNCVLGENRNLLQFWLTGVPGNLFPWGGGIYREANLQGGFPVTPVL